MGTKFVPVQLSSTDMLLIITSTGVELLRNVKIDDLE